MVQGVFLSPVDGAVVEVIDDEESSVARGVRRK